MFMFFVYYVASPGALLFF